MKKQLRRILPAILLLSSLSPLRAETFTPYFVTLESGKPLPRIGVCFDSDLGHKTHNMNVKLARGRQIIITTAVGRITQRNLEQTLANASIPSAKGQESNSDGFDIIAYLKDEGVKFSKNASQNQLTARIICSLTYKRTSGEYLATQTITGTATINDATFPGPDALVRRYEAVMNAAADDLAKKTAALLTDSGELKRILTGPSNQHLASSDALAREGARHFSAKDYRLAFWYFDRAVNASPRHQAALAYQGATLVKLGYQTSGNQQLRQAERVDSSTAEAAQARKWLLASQ